MGRNSEAGRHRPGAGQMIGRSVVHHLDVNHVFDGFEKLTAKTRSCEIRKLEDWKIKNFDDRMINLNISHFKFYISILRVFASTRLSDFFKGLVFVFFRGFRGPIMISFVLCG